MMKWYMKRIITAKIIASLDWSCPLWKLIINVTKFANANKEALLAGSRDTGSFIYIFFEMRLYLNPTVLLPSLTPFIQKLQDQP